MALEILSVCIYTRPIICIELTTLIIINYYVVVCVILAQAYASVFPWRGAGAAPAPAFTRGSASAFVSHHNIPRQDGNGASSSLHMLLEKMEDAHVIKLQRRLEM